MKPRLVCSLLLIGFLSLVGCVNGPPRSTASAGLTIECLLAYRSSVQVGIEREETVLVSKTVPLQSVAFQELIFHAQYAPGDSPPNEHSLRLWVTPVDNESELVSQLYQLPLREPLRNQFSGGHGFTGLTYVIHPTNSAELQITCSVKPE